MTNPESPAFPAEEEANVNGTMGLTKRELFVLVIIHGMAASVGSLRVEAGAAYAVAQADELLKRLEDK